MTTKTEGGRRKSEGGRKTDVSSLPPFLHWLAAIAVAIALTWIFWAPLWEGGSLIGGDLFPYFFPQKVFLADQLKHGVIPLWNPLTGHGYPTIAESQTGVCYPPDLVAYRFLSVTAAYNVVQMTHYVFAFLGTWLLARTLGASHVGAWLAGLSFVYGWCAPRICLEWAIVSGAYLPWVMWCAESYLRSTRLRFLVGLIILLTLQLLAGHFHLAFITQLLLIVYAPLRWRLLLASPLEGEGPGVLGMSRQSNPSLNRLASVSSSSSGLRPPSPSRGEGILRSPWLKVWGSIVVAFLLAAVQLAPTWELKWRSQRSDVSAEHQPGYGHLPPQYWSQVILPWIWYDGDIDANLSKLPNYSGGAGTNRVEAQLYFGIIPLILAAGGLIVSRKSREESDRVLRWWMLLGLLFLLYTPGWFLPVTQHLPGFNFFRGPGRYGIVMALAVAVTSGVMFSRLIQRLAVPVQIAGTLIVFAVTVPELSWVASRVGYSQLLPAPIVERRIDSPVRQLLAKETEPVRLFAPMANVANLLDVSSTPVYLGIGPQEYFDPQFTLPVGPNGGLDLEGDPRQIQWLQHAGVTHVYSLDRLNTKHWPVDLVWAGVDPFLHSAFGRGPEPTFLYRLKNSRGRISWMDPSDPAGQATIVAHAAHRIEAKCQSSNGGQILLTELDYPGWRLQRNGQDIPSERAGMFRAATVPPGEHTLVWTYRPASVYWGAAVSAATICGLLSASVLWRRTRKL